MGNSSTGVEWKPCSALLEGTQSQNIMDHLVFMENRNLDNQQLCLWQLQLYRLDEPPYECLMKTTRIFSNECPSMPRYFRTLEMLASKIMHKNIAPLHFVRVRQHNNMCLRTSSVDHLSSFYGLDLRDTIDSRKRADWRFDQSEIMYVARSLVSVGAYLEEFKLCFGVFKSKNIFLSSEGFLKVYLFHIDPDCCNHSAYTLTGQRARDVLAQLPVAPEVIPQQEQIQSKTVDMFKSDLFCVGMVLVEMMIEGSIDRYYSVVKGSVVLDHAKLHQSLDQLRRVYSKEAIDLISKMTASSPADRFSFSEAAHEIDKIKKHHQVACRIQMERDEEESSIKLSYKEQRPPETSHVLKSIQLELNSKMNAMPVQSISKQQGIVREQSGLSCPQKSFYTRRNPGVSVVSNQSSQNIQKMGDTTVKHCVSTLKSSFKPVSSRQLSLKDFQNSPFRKNNSQNWLNLGSTRVSDRRVVACKMGQENFVVPNNVDSNQTTVDISRTCSLNATQVEKMGSRSQQVSIKNGRSRRQGLVKNLGKQKQQVQKQQRKPSLPNKARTPSSSKKACHAGVHRMKGRLNSRLIR